MVEWRTFRINNNNRATTVAAQWRRMMVTVVVRLVITDTNGGNVRVSGKKGVTRRTGRRRVTKVFHLVSVTLPRHRRIAHLQELQRKVKRERSALGRWL
jgi:hypothetical protein